MGFTHVKISVLLSVILFGLFSCKKIHRCRCSDSSGAHQDFSIGHSTRKDARDACKSLETDLKEDFADVSCKIVS